MLGSGYHSLSYYYIYSETNGVGERTKRYIMEMSWYMLNDKELSKSILAEASDRTVFLKNGVSTNDLLKKTPFKDWN